MDLPRTGPLVVRLRTPTRAWQGGVQSSWVIKPPECVQAVVIVRSVPLNAIPNRDALWRVLSAAPKATGVLGPSSRGSSWSGCQSSSQSRDNRRERPVVHHAPWDHACVLKQLGGTADCLRYENGKQEPVSESTADPGNAVYTGCHLLASGGVGRKDTLTASGAAY